VTTLRVQVLGELALEIDGRSQPPPASWYGCYTAAYRWRSPMVRQVAVPFVARARRTLPRPDYEDVFVLETGAAHERTGEERAPALLEDAQAGMQRSLRRAWRALGLVLGSSRDERRVLGWEVRHRAPEFALLVADSWLGMVGEVLVERRRHALLVATFIQTRNPLARLVSAGVAPGHRQAVRDLLEGVAARTT
jgi:hypothetical protein